MTSRYTSRKNRFPLDINDHEEKPSQRVPSPYILVLLGFYMLMAYFAQSMEDRMPSVIKEQEIPSSESNVFSEEKANQYLHEIIGDQPRVSGTEYHLVKTKDLKALLENIASNAHVPVKIDWQYASGDYWLEFSSPHVNCYQNLSNIIAVLEGESGFHTDGSTGTSILVNCHYDSVPFAIGASDNGVFCGAMAETLSKLSRRKKKFKHNIIFLFNGSEETPLQASHAFLSHAWAKGVINVVNLDSAGMNGLPNVFQVTDPRLLRSYQRSCPRPSAQSLGEALFASGIIPSDTDFRIFRDFGNIQGVDIAFVKGGNVYHTRNDEPSLILEGVMQNTGNTLLNFIKDLADQEELAEKVESPIPMVYYDYLTLFMLSYPLTAAHIIDTLAVLFGAASVLYYLWFVGMRWSSVEELLLSALGRLLCALSGLVAVLLVTVVTAYTTTQMRYLSRPWLVVPLYWLPCAITTVAASHLYDSCRTPKHGLTAVLRAAQAMAGSRLLLTALLAALLPLPALAPIRYLLTVPLILNSAGAFVSLSVLRWRPAAWQQLVVDVAVTLPAVLLLLSLALRMSALLLPIAGRSGSSCPDCTTGVVSGALALLFLSVPSGIELVFSRRRLWVAVGVVGAACVVIMFLPLSPYQDDGTATQRHYWFHTKITSFDADMNEVNSTSGILVTKLDAYSVESAASAISAAEPGLVMRRLGSEDCEKTVYCDMPLYRPRFDRYLADSMFVLTQPPHEFVHELRLRNRSCDRNTCTLDFVMNGPGHNTIVVCPREGVNLTAWSFAAQPAATRTHRDRPVYVVVHAIGTYSDPLPSLEFQLTFEVVSPSSPLADVSHHAHKIHHPDSFTLFYRGLLLAMPKYFNVASFLTFKNNYIF